MTPIDGDIPDDRMAIVVNDEVARCVHAAKPPDEDYSEFVERLLREHHALTCPPEKVHEGRAGD